MPDIDVDQQVMAQDYKGELLSILYKRSFKYDPDKGFTLASGAKSDVYIDVKQTVLCSEGMELVGYAIYQMLKNEPVDAVGGLTLGADPVAMATAMVSTMNNKFLDVVIVRKEPKKHGTQNWIEGFLRPDLWVIVLEDVVTTGESAITAVQRLREAGCQVRKVIALVDREEGGRENIEAKTGCKFYSIFTKSDLVELDKNVKNPPPVRKGAGPRRDSEGYY